MIYVFFVPFVLLVVLGFILLSSLKNKRKRGQAFAYGQKEFDVELPDNPNIKSMASGYALPSLTAVSDAESFMMLVVPYLGSLPLKKREKIKKTLNGLSSDLKINKEVYRFFVNEFEKFEGLSDEQASDKWRGKDVS